MRVDSHLVCKGMPDSPKECLIFQFSEPKEQCSSHKSSLNVTDRVHGVAEFYEYLMCHRWVHITEPTGSH